MKRVSVFLVGSAFVLLFLVLALSPAQAGSGGTVLDTEERLDAGDYLILPNGERLLRMESDGNLVLYGREMERILWQSGTSGYPGAHYEFQADGNLVVYDTEHIPRWASNTGQNPGATLTMEDDGNLVIYSPPRPGVLWESGTSGHPGAWYEFQADGNLVIYWNDPVKGERVALWASDTGQHPGAELYLNDGNLAIYSKPNTEPIWASQTGGNPGAELVMEKDGNLVIYSAEGEALWATMTNGKPCGTNWWIYGTLWGVRYRMYDGELQVYCPWWEDRYGIQHYNTVWWRSGTAGAPDTELKMQEDGNLVIYSTTAPNLLWETGTGGHPGSELVMQEDGNLVVLSGPEPQLLWESNTGGHPGAELVMQEDGNLVIKLPPIRKAIWQTNTGDYPGAYAVVQHDGNFCVYTAANQVVFGVGQGKDYTPEHPHLVLQSDGNLVLYHGTQAVWAANTVMPWMESLGNHIVGFSIRDLAIPGTHDSGTYGLDDRKFANDGNMDVQWFNIDGYYLPWHLEVQIHWIKHTTSWWPHLPYWTCDIEWIPHAKYLDKFSTTQGKSIYQQLHSGIRYIDMRVLYDRNNLYLIHVLRGPSVFDEINDVNHYLRENPYEIVILDFNHFYDVSDDWNRKLIDHIQRTMGDLLIPPPDDVNDLTIGDIWASGKQVIVFYDRDGPNKDNFWPQSQYRSEWLDQQSWWLGGGKDGLQAAMNAETNCVVNLASGCADADKRLWVMQGILTFNKDTLGNYFRTSDYGKLAVWLDGNRGAAQSVNAYVRDWALNGPYSQDINILMGDWAETSDLVHTAIQLNLQRAGLGIVDHGIEGLPLNMTEPEPMPSTLLEATMLSVPEVVPVADRRLEATGLWTEVDLGEGAAYDHIDGWLGAEHDASEASFPIGTHTVTWASSDMVGVTGTATQTVRIVSHAPVVEEGVLWPPNHEMSTVTIEANVVPALQGLVTLSAYVTSNEPEEGLGDGDQARDWGEPEIDQEAGIIRIPLRAERSAQGYGRIYAVTVVATDGEGHQYEASVYVDVPHDRSDQE